MVNGTANQPIAAMPWEIVRLPFRNQDRDYKQYPDGASMPASDEESRIWAYILQLRRDLAEAKSKRAAKANTPG